jgi:indole-3-glycerol phosphate synthase
VLTDTPSFQGAPEFLTAARWPAPCRLAQGFHVRHLPGARGAGWGADAILIIMASLDDDDAKAARGRGT